MKRNWLYIAMLVLVASLGTGCDLYVPVYDYYVGGYDSYYYSDYVDYYAPVVYCDTYGYCY